MVGFSNGNFIYVCLYLYGMDISYINKKCLNSQ